MTLEEEARVCAAGRSYLGTPWLGQGRTKQGIDCIGAGIVMPYRDAGFEIDEGKTNYRGLDSIRLMRTLLKYFAPLEIGIALRPANVVIYRLPEAGHCALLVDGKDGLNAIESVANKKVVESRFDPTRGNIKGIYRWKDAA